MIQRKFQESASVSVWLVHNVRVHLPELANADLRERTHYSIPVPTHCRMLSQAQYVHLVVHTRAHYYEKNPSPHSCVALEIIALHHIRSNLSSRCSFLMSPLPGFRAPCRTTPSRSHGRHDGGGDRHEDVSCWDQYGVLVLKCCSKWNDPPPDVAAHDVLSHVADATINNNADGISKSQCKISLFSSRFTKIKPTAIPLHRITREKRENTYPR